MKAYKVTVLVIDHDRLGAMNLQTEMECARYGNDCVNPIIMDIQEADIGEWEDDHPLNQIATQEAEFERLFGGKK